MANPANGQAGEIVPCETEGLLALLKLQVGDRDELRRQGFVSREVRKEASYFKLRFRRHGRQVVIGLGHDPQLAERIGRELAELQANRRLEREQTRLICAARDLLRRAKRALEPALRDAGFGFHGYEIRRLPAAHARRNQRERRSEE